MLYDKKWDSKIEAPLRGWQQDLMKAADLIEQRGWCQHTFHDGAGRMCALGAIIEATNSRKVHYAYRDAAVRLMESLKIIDIPTWNDLPWRTKDGVVTAMRAAAMKGE